MLSFVNSFMSWYLKKRISAMELSYEEPGLVQKTTFRHLLSKAKQTSFGKDYHLNEVKTFEEFKTRVPLYTYDQLKPYILRVMHGEQSVLWPDEVKWFAKSSGTTSDKSKFIPVSFEALENCQFRGSRDVLAFYYHDNPEAKIFQGKGLIIGGSHQVNELNNNSHYGDLSAILMNNMPFIANYLATPTLDIAMLNNWEEKLSRMVETTFNEDVTNISGVPTWTMILIQKLLLKGKTSSLMDIWPNLELYVHGGVNFQPYQKYFKTLIPSNAMNYREIYNASEGFFGVQDQPGKDMMLMLDYGIFYEFIRQSELCLDNPKTLWIDEIEIGEDYGVVINTNAGLWRYRLGDTIKFTSKTPYRFIISGRTKQHINTFGEEVMIHDVESVITQVQIKFNCQVSDFTVAPVYLSNENQGRHHWLIEFEHAPTNLQEFERAIDEELQNFNSDYEAKRAGNIVLIKPLVEICKKGTFYNWLKKKNKIGGQHKVPRLSNDRKIIEELIKIKNENN